MQESSSFPSSSSSCQQRLMQKVRRLSAAALWSISFNPLHLSSLPPPPSPPPSLQSASLSFLLHAPLRIPIFSPCSRVGRMQTSLYGVAAAFSPSAAAAEPLQQILHLANQQINPAAKIGSLAKFLEICDLLTIKAHIG